MRISGRFLWHLGKSRGQDQVAGASLGAEGGGHGRPGACTGADEVGAAERSSVEMVAFYRETPQKKFEDIETVNIWQGWGCTKHNHLY